MALFDLFRRKKRVEPDPVQTRVEQDELQREEWAQQRHQQQQAEQEHEVREHQEAQRDIGSADRQAQAAQEAEIQRLQEEAHALPETVQDAPAPSPSVTEEAPQDLVEAPADDVPETLPVLETATEQQAHAGEAAAALDADDPPHVQAERERVEEMLSAVGPELRTRRIIDLLGITFGRLAPEGEWGSTRIDFRPARGRIYLQVSTDGPEGGRAGEGSWNAIASFVEILIQELQRSMYEPVTGTWFDGHITYTFRGQREDHRGRPVAPESDVQVNYSHPPSVGVQESPWSVDDLIEFFHRFPRSPEAVPGFARDWAKREGRTLPGAPLAGA